MTIPVMCAYPNSQVLILISYRMAYIIIIIITRMQYRSQLYAYINIWNIYIIIISIYIYVCNNLRLKSFVWAFFFWNANILISILYYITHTYMHIYNIYSQMVDSSILSVILFFLLLFVIFAYSKSIHCRCCCIVTDVVIAVSFAFSIFIFIPFCRYFFLLIVVVVVFILFRHCFS